MTAKRSTFYCKHCGNDCGPPVDEVGNGDRLCPARDGDYCEPKRRTKLQKPTLPKPNDPGFKLPRSALAHVVNLATYGKFDRYGEGTGLEKDDVDAIVKVCATFRIELPDSPYLPKKPTKPKKRRRS
jgi:hypothetical protein